MKDYQLYLEKITNALSRAGISYPAPSFIDYESMWSYVEGLSSFLELNAQLQKSGAGVVLMGLEESTTFKSYWNSEFYQEFQERKLLESKISSNPNDSEMESDGEEIYLDETAEFSSDVLENDSKTKGLATGLVVGSVVGSVLGSSLVGGVDASELESDSVESEEVSPLEGYNSYNVVFIDDDEDEEVRYDEDGFVIEDEDALEEEDGSGSPVKAVTTPSLEGYDSSNIVFVDDDDDEDGESDDESNEDELQYDEDGFVILDKDEENNDSDDSGVGEYTYDEFGNKYDKDGFIVMDDDEEEEYFENDGGSDDLDSSSEDSDDGYTYDEFGNKYDSDGFLVEDEDEEEEDSPDSPSQRGITYEPDGTYYDEYGNHFDSDGFLIEDEEEELESEEPQPQVEADGSYYDEYGNHFDANGFLIEDDDDLEEESQPQAEADGSYYDEYGNHFDADGFLIEDEDEVSEEDDDSDSGDSSSNVQPDGSYYDDFGNHYDADGFLIEDEGEVLEEDEFPTPTQRVSAPSQPSTPVREAREEVVSPPPKPKIIMPKEVQTADKIMSLFGGMESKLRKKVQDVKKPKN